MKKSFDTARMCRIVAIAAAALGLLLRVGFALLPLQAHLVLLEDDAWMVTAIARNVAQGLGVTADGINPTTGFQPLYPLTLGALPYLVAPQALDGGFTANLVICALLGTLALLPLWLLATQLGGPLAGAVAVALAALNPALVRLTVNGMETSFALLLLLTLFALSVILDLTRLRSALLLGVVTALAVLARLDASLAFAAIAATMTIRAVGHPVSWSPGHPVTWPRRLLPLVTYLATTLVLLVPYFLFNRSITGDLGPSSGAALLFMQSYRGSFALTNGLSAVYQQHAIWLDWLPGLPTKAVVLLAAVAGASWLLRAQIGALLPLALFLPLPPLYYGYLLQQIRERYFVGFSCVLIVIVACCIAKLVQQNTRLPARASYLVLLNLVIALNSIEAFAFYRTMQSHPELTQPTSYQAAIWIRDNLPADALIGAKNSGIYQYYSGHTVLNIDGKLNHEILPQLQARTLLPYLRERGVQYLVDREETMARHVMLYSQAFGPFPAHRTPGIRERVAIYGTIMANYLGANLPLDLDDPRAFVPLRPFSTVADIVQRFERRNERTNPVVVFRLRPGS